MIRVFADTLYWVAIARPGDPWTAPARRATESLGDVQIVTTDEVLTEFLAAVCDGGPAVRLAAAEIVRKTLTSPHVVVVAQSRDSFVRALNRYALRADKRYSLTDCSAMNAMDEFGIRDVLTNDRHFEQEGYNVLIRQP